MSSNDTVLVFEEVLVNLIKKVADEGDVHAQLAFGLCCEEGKGVEENFGKALRYLLKAAEQGNKDAQFEVGSLFMDKSEKKAFEWFLKAATQEHLLAQFEIAVSYKRGKGVRKDIRKATRWWNRAIKRANSKLPMRYFKQFGVLDQYRNVLAVMGWLDESHAKQGAAEECNDGCVYWRQNIPPPAWQTYTLHSDSVNPMDDALKCWNSSAIQFNREAKFYLACSESLDKTMKKIFEIYAEEGPRIIRTPGVYFLNTYMKIEKLKEYTESDLLEAPDGMDIDSQYYGLAFCYHVGFGMNKDEKKAFQWFLKAAKRGHKDASFYVAKCHENGQCVKKDSKKAFEWFLKAAEREHKDAIFSVAECYENGKGVKKDSKKAVQWYTKSVATLKALNDALEKKKILVTWKWKKTRTTAVFAIVNSQRQLRP